jgi:hypothetical protein
MSSRRPPYGLALDDLVLLKVSAGLPLVISAAELYRLVSLDNVAHKEALRLGKRWSSGELKARRLPLLSVVDPASARPPTTRRREGLADVE